MSADAAIRVGSLTVRPVFDGVATLEPENFTVGTEPADWAAHQHLLDADGKLRVPVGVFLVEVGDKLLMLDAGVGQTSSAMFEGAELLNNLAAAGVSPNDVDVIMISHMHSDHMGWVTDQRGESTFPNATIYAGAADWEYFVTNNGGGQRRGDQMRAVESQVELIHTDGVTILPGVTTRATPGHTPGHTSTVLSSGAERLIVLGDALHCPAQLTETEWQFFYDVDRDLATRTRDSLRREAEDPNTALLPAHFPGMTAARLVGATGTKRWVMS